MKPIKKKERKKKKEKEKIKREREKLFEADLSQAYFVRAAGGQGGFMCNQTEIGRLPAWTCTHRATVTLFT